jgi:hypothetical protein
MWNAVVGFFWHFFAASNPLWWYYPLCAVVAVVYKTTKFDQPREIALAALHFFVSVSLGMLALALGFYLFQALFC